MVRQRNTKKQLTNLVKLAKEMRASVELLSCTCSSSRARRNTAEAAGMAIQISELGEGARNIRTGQKYVAEMQEERRH